MPPLVRRYGFAAAIVLTLGVMTLAVLGKVVVSAFSTNEASAGQSGQATIVAVAEAQTQTFANVIQAIGAAEARESIILTPKVSDTIRAIRFESGQRVRRGQVLVEMASVEQAADLAEARAQAQAAQEDLRRTQGLFDRGFASQARLDTVRAAAEAAQARVDGGASRIADRTIRAPFDGVVGLRQASPGEYVSPGDQIGTLDDISEIKLDFDVAESQLAQLAPGVALTARTAAYPDMVFEGRIAQVDTRVAAATRTVRVRAMLPNRDGRLRPGMLMTVEVAASPRDAVGAPETAIMDQADGVYVFRVANQDGALIAERRRVETGARVAGDVEILSGLEPGDRVVVEGLQSVRDGQPVRLRDAPRS